MKSREDIIERKKCILDQLWKFVRIARKLVALEKNAVANRDEIYGLIMEYDSIMCDTESVFNFHGKSPRQKNRRQKIYQSYRNGTASVGFSYFVYEMIRCCRTAIKELNFVIKSNSYSYVE